MIPALRKVQFQGVNCMRAFKSIKNKVSVLPKGLDFI